MCWEGERSGDRAENVSPEACVRHCEHLLDIERLCLTESADMCFVLMGKQGPFQTQRNWQEMAVKQMSGCKPLLQGMQNPF